MQKDFSRHFKSFFDNPYITLFIIQIKRLNVYLNFSVYS